MNIQTEDLPQQDIPQSPQAAAKGDQIVHLALGPRFGVTDANQAENDKMAEIWAYAAGMAKSSDIQDIIWEVIHLEGVLGAPKLGESRLDRLYRYTKLKRQEKNIQEELKNVSLSTGL